MTHALSGLDGATPLKTAFVVSAAAHAVVFVALAVTVESPRPKTLPPLRAYRVNIAPAAPPQVPAASAAAHAPVAVPPPAPTPPKPVSVTPKVPEKAKAPAPKKDTPKPKESAPPSKGSVSGAGGASTGTAPGGVSGPAAGIGGTGSGGVVGQLDGGDFEFAWYLDSVQRKVAQAWLKPAAFTARADAVVYFRIGRDGRVRDAAVTQSSGDSAYDRAALRAVLASSPMPPLPRQFTGDSLGVHFTFLREGSS